ncbi:hypothetical protein SMICM304S_05233 [Streptomyces microflavus]
MIHAPRPGAPVRIAPIDQMPFAGATPGGIVPVAGPLPFGATPACTMANAVQDYARTLTLRSPAHYRVGPFTVRHNPGWELKYANYAIPDRGAANRRRQRGGRPGRGRRRSGRG